MKNHGRIFARAAAPESEARAHAILEDGAPRPAASFARAGVALVADVEDGAAVRTLMMALPWFARTAR